jgi:hypothetical protein
MAHLARHQLRRCTASYVRRSLILEEAITYCVENSTSLRPPELRTEPRLKSRDHRLDQQQEGLSVGTHTRGWEHARLTQSQTSRSSCCNCQLRQPPQPKRGPPRTQCTMPSPHLQRRIAHPGTAPRYLRQKLWLRFSPADKHQGISQ